MFLRAWQDFNAKNAGHKIVWAEEKLTELDRKGVALGVIKCFTVNNQGE